MFLIFSSLWWCYNRRSSVKRNNIGATCKFPLQIQWTRFHGRSSRAWYNHGHKILKMLWRSCTAMKDAFLWKFSEISENQCGWDVSVTSPGLNSRNFCSLGTIIQILNLRLRDYPHCLTCLQVWTTANPQCARFLRGRPVLRSCHSIWTFTVR